ncbi:small ribosomal subunit protein mS37 [Anabrus simplex]|uniref:small ribosomal subunit protein mS37 n=1 Tax=Anabrus simplex TaxID=316456 RepID=UPI0034DD3C6E
MRPSSCLLVKQGRRPAREPFEFQELLPLRLKTSVSGKGEKTHSVACLQEMSLLFVCLKKNDFNEAVCGKEAQVFKKCYKDYLDNKFKKEERERKGEMIIGTKNLGHKQINQLLKRFPPS